MTETCLPLPLVTLTDTIRDTASIIERYSKGVALVVAEQQRLLATITDGDIRRAILAGMDLGASIRELLQRRAPTSHQGPLTAPVGTSDFELLRLMNEHTIRHIPLLNEMGQVVALAELNNLLKEFELPLTAVVMAGGFGTRLRPLTDGTPKPMLPVGDRPLMELTIAKLRQAGIRRVNVTTHYRGDRIMDHFGDGNAFGVELSYVREDMPLGTAGALGLVQVTNEPLLVINGDILTRLDYRAMLTFHQEQQADLTVAVRQYAFQVPYGVTQCEGAKVHGLIEKPEYKVFVNAGIYLLSPSVLRYIPKERHYNMTDLIQALLKDQGAVVCFPVWEYWLDIGRPTDYEQAQVDVRSGRLAA